MQALQLLILVVLAVGAATGNIFGFICYIRANLIKLWYRSIVIIQFESLILNRIIKYYLYGFCFLSRPYLTWFSAIIDCVGL